jgi:desulfoferrodoxin (superoxide reductase-like protein)
VSEREKEITAKPAVYGFGLGVSVTFIPHSIRRRHHHQFIMFYFSFDENYVLNSFIRSSSINDK